MSYWEIQTETKIKVDAVCGTVQNIEREKKTKIKYSQEYLKKTEF